MGNGGYVEVLRRVPAFRLLFVARSISLLGDWFSLLAVIALLREVTGSSPTALSGVLILKLLPFFLAGPVAGVVADRFDRKTILVVSDVLRGVFTLALIGAPLAPRPLVCVYVLVTLQVVGSAFFEPARNAALPRIVPARYLSAANALGAVSWSAMFALGAALGGLVTDQLGWRAALAIDAGTYGLSAMLVGRIALPRRTVVRQGTLDWPAALGLRDLRDGLGFILRRPPVATVILIKAGWSIAGAITLFLTLFGERVYAIGGRPDLGVGLLMVARALGTGIGPLLARRVVSDESPAALRRLLGLAYVWPVVWYVAFSFARHPAAAAACVMLAHFGGSVLWVYSTVLLQRMVPDRFLGRVMSTDMGLSTLILSLSTWVYGMLAAVPGADLRVLLRWMALSVLLPAAAWMVAAARWPVGERVAGAG